MNKLGGRQRVARFEILGHSYPVFEGMNIIGRDFEATILIKNLKLSKKHAVISVIGNNHYITDFNSSNGTKLDNHVIFPFVYHNLFDMSRITLGNITGTYFIHSENCEVSSTQHLTGTGKSATQNSPTDINTAATQKLTNEDLVIGGSNKNQSIVLCEDTLNLNDSMDQSFADIVVDDSLVLNTTAQDNSLVIPSTQDSGYSKKDTIEVKENKIQDEKVNTEPVLKDISDHSDSETDIEEEFINIEARLRNKIIDPKTGLLVSKPPTTTTDNQVDDMETLKLRLDNFKASVRDYLRRENKKEKLEGMSDSDDFDEENIDYSKFDFLAPQNPRDACLDENNRSDLPSTSKNFSDDDETDFLAPTQPLTPQKSAKNDTDEATKDSTENVPKGDSKTETEPDYLGPTQPLTQNESKNSKNSEPQSREENDFLGPTQPLTQIAPDEPKTAQPVHLEDNSDFLGPTQDLESPQKEPSCSNDITDKNKTDLNTSEDEHSFLAPTQDLENIEQEPCRSDENIVKSVNSASDTNKTGSEKSNDKSYLGPKQDVASLKEPNETQAERALNNEKQNTLAESKNDKKESDLASNPTVDNSSKEPRTKEDSNMESTDNQNVLVESKNAEKEHDLISNPTVDHFSKEPNTTEDSCVKPAHNQNALVESKNAEKENDMASNPIIDNDTEDSPVEPKDNQEIIPIGQNKNDESDDETGDELDFFEEKDNPEEKIPKIDDLEQKTDRPQNDDGGGTCDDSDPVPRVQQETVIPTPEPANNSDEDTEDEIDLLEPTQSFENHSLSIKNTEDLDLKKENESTGNLNINNDDDDETGDELDFLDEQSESFLCKNAPENNDLMEKTEISVPKSNDKDPIIEDDDTNDESCLLALTESSENVLSMSGSPIKRDISVQKPVTSTPRTRPEDLKIDDDDDDTGDGFDFLAQEKSKVDNDNHKNTAATKPNFDDLTINDDDTEDELDLLNENDMKKLKLSPKSNNELVIDEDSGDELGGDDPKNEISVKIVEPEGTDNLNIDDDDDDTGDELDLLAQEKNLQIEKELRVMEKNIEELEDDINFSAPTQVLSSKSKTSNHCPNTELKKDSSDFLVPQIPKLTVKSIAVLNDQNQILDDDDDSSFLAPMQQLIDNSIKNASINIENKKLEANPSKDVDFSVKIIEAEGTDNLNIADDDDTGDELDLLAQEKDLEVQKKLRVMEKNVEELEDDINFSAPTQVLSSKSKTSNHCSNTLLKEGSSDFLVPKIPKLAIKSIEVLNNQNQFLNDDDDSDFLAPMQQLIDNSMRKSRVNIENKRLETDVDFSAPTQELIKDSTNKNIAQQNLSNINKNVEKTETDDDTDFFAPTQKLSGDSKNEELNDLVASSPDVMNEPADNDIVLASDQDTSKIISTDKQHDFIHPKNIMDTDFSAPTQKLNMDDCENDYFLVSTQKMIPSTSKNTEKNDDELFMAPTQFCKAKKAKTAQQNEKDDDDLFLIPTQQLMDDSKEIGSKNVEPNEDDELFMAPTQELMKCSKNNIELETNSQNNELCSTKEQTNKSEEKIDAQKSTRRISLSLKKDKITSNLDAVVIPELALKKDTSTSNPVVISEQSLKKDNVTSNLDPVVISDDDSNGSDIVIRKKPTKKIPDTQIENIDESDSDSEIGYKHKRVSRIIETQEIDEDPIEPTKENSPRIIINDYSITDDDNLIIPNTQLEESMKLILEESIESKSKETETQLELDLPTEKEYFPSIDDRPNNPLVQILTVDNTQDLNTQETQQEKNKLQTKDNEPQLNKGEKSNPSSSDNTQELDSADIQNMFEKCDKNIKICLTKIDENKPMNVDPELKDRSLDKLVDMLNEQCDMISTQKNKLDDTIASQSDNEYTSAATQLADEKFGETNLENEKQNMEKDHVDDSLEKSENDPSDLDENAEYFNSVTQPINDLVAQKEMDENINRVSEQKELEKAPETKVKKSRTKKEIIKTRKSTRGHTKDVPKKIDENVSKNKAGTSGTQKRTASEKSEATIETTKRNTRTNIISEEETDQLSTIDNAHKDTKLCSESEMLPSKRSTRKKIINDDASEEIQVTEPSGKKTLNRTEKPESVIEEPPSEPARKRPTRVGTSDTSTSKGAPKTKNVKKDEATEVVTSRKRTTRLSSATDEKDEIFAEEQKSETASTSKIGAKTKHIETEIMPLRKRTTRLSTSAQEKDEIQEQKTENASTSKLGTKTKYIKSVDTTEIVPTRKRTTRTSTHEPDETLVEEPKPETQNTTSNKMITKTKTIKTDETEIVPSRKRSTRTSATIHEKDEIIVEEQTSETVPSRKRATRQHVEEESKTEDSEPSKKRATKKGIIHEDTSIEKNISVSSDETLKITNKRSTRGSTIHEEAVASSTKNMSLENIKIQKSISSSDETSFVVVEPLKKRSTRGSSVFKDSTKVQNTSKMIISSSDEGSSITIESSRKRSTRGGSVLEEKTQSSKTLDDTTEPPRKRPTRRSTISEEPELDPNQTKSKTKVALSSDDNIPGADLKKRTTRRTIPESDSSDAGPSKQKVKKIKPNADEGIDSVVELKKKKLDQLVDANVTRSPSVRGLGKLKHKVVFTMLDDANLEATITRLGGSIVNSSHECTVLVTTKISRSLKFLVAVSMGKPIVGADWIRASGQAHRFLDPWDYILADPESEEKFDFILKDTIKLGGEQKMLDGYTILLLVSKNSDVLKEVIESCGGKCVTRAPPKNVATNLIIVSYEEDRSKFGRFLKQKPPVTVVAAEAIFAGALSQRLNLQQHLLT